MGLLRWIIIIAFHFNGYLGSKLEGSISKCYGGQEGLTVQTNQMHFLHTKKIITEVENNPRGVIRKHIMN